MLAAGGAAPPAHVALSLAALIPLLFLLLGPAVASVKRAFSATHAVQDRLQDRRARAWSAIDADHILPTVAGVLADAHPVVDWDDPRVGPSAVPLEEDITDALQRFGLAKRLTGLATVYGDRLNCDRLQDSIIGWLHFQGWAAAVYAPAAGYVAVAVSLKHAHLPMAAHYAAALVLTVSVTLWIVGGVEEVRARNRVARIFRIYES